MNNNTDDYILKFKQELDRIEKTYCSNTTIDEYIHYNKICNELFKLTLEEINIRFLTKFKSIIALKIKTNCSDEIIDEFFEELDNDIDMRLESKNECLKKLALMQKN